MNSLYIDSISVTNLWVSVWNQNNLCSCQTSFYRKRIVTFSLLLYQNELDKFWDVHIYKPDLALTLGNFTDISEIWDTIPQGKTKKLCESKSEKDLILWQRQDDEWIWESKATCGTWRPLRHFGYLHFAYLFHP